MLSGARSLGLVLSAIALVACGRASPKSTGSPPGSGGAIGGASGVGGSAGLDGGVVRDAGRDAHADADASTNAFVHPGCLSTQADLARMKAKVAAGAQPWKGSWDKLVANAHAQTTYTPNPQAMICAGSPCMPENFMTLANDVAAAYQLALRYHVSGDTSFAAAAARILDAWASTLTAFTGDSNVDLRAGLYGYQLASAGELLRTYASWEPTGLQRLLTGVFYPINSDFLQRHNDACDGNYWANWDLATMASMIATGVFADRRDIFNQAVDYFRNGIGQGSIGNAVFFIHPDGTGQWQESGRDQGHATLGPMLMAVVCEIAWNQGVDLYGDAGNRFLLGSEYVASYNLGNDVPYVAYTFYSGPQGSCKEGVQSTISTDSRMLERAGWEPIFNHYVNRMGFAAPFTAQYAAALRPEGGGGDYGPNSGGFDSLGFTTLTHTLDPVAAGAVPNSLRPFVHGQQITLSWTGSAYATGYKIKRSSASGGPYMTIGQSAGTSYADSGLSSGVSYYYVVSALTPAGETANSAEAAASPDSQLFGTAIGTAGSFGNVGATKELALDGSLENFFDGPDSASWVGLDLGAGASAVIAQVRYTPRKTFGSRMVGGKFQGASTADFSSGVTDLFTISAAPPDGVLTTQTIANPTAFRYVRYQSPTGGFGNVAEVQFFGR